MSKLLLIRTNLMVTALVMIGFGVWALFDPLEVATSQDLGIRSANGILAVQTIFGGNLIGTGLLFAFCGLDERHYRIGLISILAIISPILATRGFSMMLENQYSVQHLIKLVMEIASVTVTLVLYRANYSPDQRL